MIQATGFNGRVTFDGQVVTIYRENSLARRSVGGGTKTIPISSLNLSRS